MKTFCSFTFSIAPVLVLTSQLFAGAQVTEVRKTTAATRPRWLGCPVLEPTDRAERLGSASAHYGLLWWNNNDGTLADVLRYAFWPGHPRDSLGTQGPMSTVEPRRVFLRLPTGVHGKTTPG